MSGVALPAGIDRRALIFSLLVAAAAFIALAFLVDRLERLAKAQPIVAERLWSAPAGSELRLGGLAPGTLLTIESAAAGGGLTVQAEGATSAAAGGARRLLWMTGRGDPGDDNKAALQIALTKTAPDGIVILSRSGEATAPQLRIEARGVTLSGKAGVVIGDSLSVPITRIFADGREVEPTAPVFAFTVRPGGTLSVELPAIPNNLPSGINIRVGPARSDRQDTQLPLGELAIAREGAATPDKAACAAPAGRYAVAPVMRAALAPTPTGGDCRAGGLSATSLEIGRDSVALNLAGSAYVTVDGKPTASIWSWALSNPVLEIGINKALPLAVSAIFGFVTFRRRSAAAERKAAKPDKPKPRRKPTRATR